MPNESIKMLNIIKQVAKEAVTEAVPSGWQYGIVTSTGPLVIQLENQLPIPEDNLELTKNTTCWTVEMDVDHQTENAAGGSGDAQYASHHHGYLGRKKFRVHNELTVGDKVILARVEGGQRYIVIDKVYNIDRGCTS